MAKVKQTEDDLKSQLKDQIQLLVNSCHSYDKGCKIEAKNIAIRLRVLLYDTKSSISLLTLMNKKNILFHDSAHDEGLLSPFMSVIGIQVTSKGTEYIPNLDEIPDLTSNRFVNFDEWWSNPIIKGPFTRGEFIRYVSHMDGGAHVDPKLNKKYANLTRNNSMGWTHHGYNGEITTPDGIEFAVLRQIAYEVLKTFEKGFPEIFKSVKNLV